ncbi:MAG: 30S ribosomal protein S20 [Candidatus Bipolaricaulota bacterium]
MIKIPNIRSAKKRLRQSGKRRGLNRAKKAALKRVTKQIKTHLAAGDGDSARALLPELAKVTDKAAKHHTIHKNKASRIKSRWTRKVGAV